MHVFFRQLCWSVLSGVLLTVIGGAVYRGYEIAQAGYALDSVPPLKMIFDVMQLHEMAAYGAAAGVVFAVLGPLFDFCKRSISSLFRRAPPVVDQPDPDSIIRAERAQLADSYLSSLGERSLDHVLVTPHDDEEAPGVENMITARGGTFSYRVLAYRHLSEEERIRVVQEALRLGHVQEPPSGGTSTVMTSIGK